MNTRTRIKFCGITSVDDAQAAVAAGADAIGLVFYESSPRYIDLEIAKQVAESIPAFVSVVGLFVNASSDSIKEVLQSVKIDLLQFHGDEKVGFCSNFKKPYIKALRIKPDTDVVNEIAKYSSASAILLDAWHPDLRGGSGEVINWTTLSALIGTQSLGKEIVLAGGLDHNNVKEAISIIKPYAVDVSSGIETAPGVKSPVLMNEFTDAVRATDDKGRNINDF